MEMDLRVMEGAARRWQQRSWVREPRRAALQAGRIVDIETPERIQKRLERLTMIATEARAAQANTSRSGVSQTPPLVETIGLERIMGKADVLGISFLELALAMSRFVGRIHIRSRPGHTAGFGTGCMVSPRLLLTTNHVLGSVQEALYSEVEFDYQYDRLERLLPVRIYGLEPQTFFLTNPELDYTLVAVRELSLDGISLERYGWSRLIGEQGKALLGDALNIIQHPQGEAKQIVLRSNQLIDLFDQFAHYVNGTEPGSSGSPVYNDQWEMVALHHSGVPKMEDGHYVAKDGAIWRPGMDPDDLEWVANEGIRVSSLVDHIQSQSLPREQGRLRDELFHLDPPHPLEAVTTASNWILASGKGAPGSDSEMSHTEAVPRESKQISAWISELTQARDESLLVGHAYTLNFKVGSSIASSLITGADAHVSPAEVPEQGLDTKWVVMSRDVEFPALSPEVTIKTRRLGNAQSWTAQFDLHIPKDGESAIRQLRITPRHASIATLEINIFSAGELFRQFLVELLVASVEVDDGSNGTPTVAVKDDTIITLPGELGLQPQNEWQTPPGKLQIIVVGDDRAYVQGSIFADGAWLDIGDSTEWHTSQTHLNGLITNVRRAAERFREDSEFYLNSIEPADLAARLTNFQPLYTWDEAHDQANRQTDLAHTESWEQVRQSERLHDLAAEGYVLYQRLFPAGSDLRPWLDGLTPGHLLDIRWTQKDRAGVSSIPWSLIYMADPDDPIDPLRFMGLRFRLSYWAHAMAPTSQALGDPATTYRAHLLYWGNASTDAASVEARWQRDLWAEFMPQVVTEPASATPKAALLQVIRAPEPVPMTVLYLFCHCDVGEGNEVVLRFGSTKDRKDIIRQTELPNKPFEKGPLVFANACTTVASDPTIANELETRFFERGCRAFIGTETKVPIRFASRFAAIFFHFFYRRASETPVAAGEAVTQTRLFLWTHYKNIGGILYSYINRYDLLLAGDEELKALRVP